MPLACLTPIGHRVMCVPVSRSAAGIYLRRASVRQFEGSNHEGCMTFALAPAGARWRSGSRWGCWTCAA